MGEINGQLITLCSPWNIIMKPSIFVIDKVFQGLHGWKKVDFHLVEDLPLNSCALLILFSCGD